MLLPGSLWLLRVSFEFDPKGYFFLLQLLVFLLWDEVAWNRRFLWLGSLPDQLLRTGDWRLGFNHPLTELLATPLPTGPVKGVAIKRSVCVCGNLC